MATVTRGLPTPPELTGRWVQVFEEAEVRPRILEVADRFPELRSLEVPFARIEAADTPLADALLERPEEVLPAGVQAMRELVPVGGTGSETEGLRLRIIGLPLEARRQVRAIRESDLQKFLALEGIVRKATEVRPQIRDAVFICTACHTEIHELQDEIAPVLREPVECPGCQKSAGKVPFRLHPERSTYIDTQRIEIQENPEKLKGGAHPQGLSVLLTEDLTGKVLPGNRVTVNGTLKSLQRASASRVGVLRSTTFDLILFANSVEQQQKEYQELDIPEEDLQLIRRFQGDPHVVDQIVLSLAPTIKGMEDEKEAIALQMFGGVGKLHPDGVRVRGDIHILLVGDPGTAKSQLLRYVAEVAPRGIYTSGKGATAAGLTAAAVKDDFAGGRWVLEAGMLVLADGGMAIIDELDKMTPEDRSAMHEALEQQTVSVAKAGITATLNARCPVLAAANPKWGRFNPEKFISEQIDLPPTLLSRFDVIYSIQDRPNREKDRLLAGRILQTHKEAGYPGADLGLPTSAGAPFPPKFLREYIAYARQNVSPVLSDEALRFLEDFYVKVRSRGEEPNSPVPITARQLEALVRLSEAAARARLSPVVSILDAQRATVIVQKFLDRITPPNEKLDIDVVTTGVPHSQRERIDLLQDTIRRLQEEGGGSFALEDLIGAAEKLGLTRKQVESNFQLLRNQGEVIEPRTGRWQLTRF